MPCVAVIKGTAKLSEHEICIRSQLQQSSQTTPEAAEVAELGPHGLKFALPAEASTLLVFASSVFSASSNSKGEYSISLHFVFRIFDFSNHALRSTRNVPR